MITIDLARFVVDLVRFSGDFDPSSPRWWDFFEYANERVDKLQLVTSRQCFCHVDPIR